MPRNARTTSGFWLGIVLALGLLVGVGKADAAACAPGGDGVCLLGGRFRAEVTWVGSPAGEARAEALGRRAAYFRSPAGDALVVEIVDGGAVNGHFWVLSGVASGAEGNPRYALTVTDLADGSSRDYSELQPAADVHAFAAQGERGPRPGSASSLALEHGRVTVEMDGRRAQTLGERTGYLWSDDAASPEVVVSLVDGRALGEPLWLLTTAPDGAVGSLRAFDAAAGQSLAIELTAGDRSPRVQALLGPRAVTIALDRTRSASAIVPVAGATLTATSANGTVFTLIIPAGALLSEEKITLTPVVSVGGLPFHPGLVGAVHLEPAGLRLFQAATLRIKPRVAVPRAQEVTFAYRGLGKELFLFPPSINAAGVEMKLLHFSGYGVAKGALAELTAQLLRLPTLAEDRMSQKLDAIVSKKRRGGKSLARDVAPMDIQDDLALVLRSTYSTSIQPNLVAVTKSCAVFKKLMPLMLGWARQVQLLGLSEYDGEIAGILEALGAGVANCYNEAFTKCVVGHEPQQVVNMLSYLRQVQLLGVDDQVDPGRLDKCVRFDLDFETDTQYDTLAPNPFGIYAGYRMRLRSKVPLRLDLGGVSHVHGTAPLVWDSATWDGTLPEGVSVHHVGPGDSATLDVIELAFDLNFYEGAPPPPNIKLIYDPGAPTVVQIFDFENDPGVEFPPFQWRPAFYFVHGDETTLGTSGPLVARDWPLVGGAVWARRTYQRSKSVPGTFIFSETTLIDLIHTPEP